MPESFLGNQRKLHRAGYFILGLPFYDILTIGYKFDRMYIVINTAPREYNRFSYLVIILIEFQQIPGMRYAKGI